MAAELSIVIKASALLGSATSAVKKLGESFAPMRRANVLLRREQMLLGKEIANSSNKSAAEIAKLERKYNKLGQTIKSMRRLEFQSASLDNKLSSKREARSAMKTEAIESLAMVGTLMLPIKLSVDFESAMAGVKKVVDFDTPQQFKQMEQDLLSLTHRIPMTGKELADIAASGGQLGVARQDLIGFTEQIAKMSVAFDMSAGDAGDSMAKLANVYKIPISEIGKLGDAINHLSNESPAKANDIVNTLGRVGGVAKQFGLTELQAASLANTFISLGKAPEVAGTAINGMLTKLITADKQGAKFQKVLKDMGTDSKQLKKAIAENGEQALKDFLAQINKLPKEQQMGALVDLFGREYADDIAVLTGSLETYEKSIHALQKTGADGKLEFLGSMDKEFASQAATTAKQFQTLKNHLVHLGISIGAVALPALNSLMESIKPLVSEVIKFAEANPKLVKSFMMVAAALVSFKAGSLATRFVINILSSSFLGVARFVTLAGLTLSRFAVVLRVVGTALMANPIGIALGLLAVAAWVLYRNWSDVVGGAKALWQDFCSFLGRISSAIANFFRFAWEQIKAFFSSGILNISATIINWSPIGLFYQAFAAVMGWFGVTLPAKFTEFGSNIMTGLWNGLKAKFEAVKAWFAGAAASFSQSFQKINQIHSPSRLFKRFGGWMMEGLQIGLDAGSHRPLTAIGGAANQMRDRFAERMGNLRANVAARLDSAGSAFSAERGRMAADGTVTIHYNPTINVQGSDVTGFQEALRMSQRDFEEMFRRMMADNARRAY